MNMKLSAVTAVVAMMVCASDACCEAKQQICSLSPIGSGSAGLVLSCPDDGKLIDCQILREW